MNIFEEQVEILKTNRSMIGPAVYDKYDFPVITNQFDSKMDWNNLYPVNLQNAAPSASNSNKILLMFRYDRQLESLWNAPLKKVCLFKSYAAVSTPDYSIYPSMNRNEIRHNIFKNRWLGHLWQNMGVTVYPSVGWGSPDTYDMCFSAIEEGSVVVISTLGCLQNEEFFLEGYEEMLNRIKPSIVIVYGNLIPGMKGKILNFKYQESLKKDYVQPNLPGIARLMTLEGGIA